MAQRRIEAITNQAQGREAKVFHDAEWQEYVVKFYSQGKPMAGSDYHTDDKGDAQRTARFWTWREDLE